MTVAELIGLLKSQTKDLQVAYCLHSEWCLLALEAICIFEACAPRPDGWIQNRRPGMPMQKYLLLPGN